MDKPKLPQLAWNLTKSLVNYAKSGFENATKKKYKKRLSICDVCEFLDRKQSRCNSCGCIVVVKAKWEVEKCPEDKW